MVHMQVFLLGSETCLAKTVTDVAGLELRDWCNPPNSDIAGASHRLCRNVLWFEPVSNFESKPLNWRMPKLSNTTTCLPCRRKLGRVRLRRQHRRIALAPLRKHRIALASDIPLLSFDLDTCPTEEWPSDEKEMNSCLTYTSSSTERLASGATEVRETHILLQTKANPLHNRENHLGSAVHPGQTCGLSYDSSSTNRLPHSNDIRRLAPPPTIHGGQPRKLDMTTFEHR
eukprot:Gb_12933 [translate_table: standard]